ncbi:MAG: hypothetical protein GEU97_10770 [Actinophytocola sp.]|nr:hypothetical protein [Actinophytocola sp.]
MALLAGGCASEVVPARSATPTALTEGFRIVPEPAFNASGVSPVQPIRIIVTDGTLLSISLRNDEGADVAGELSDDQRQWVATEPLGFDRRYTWSGTAFDAEGERFPIEGSFRTVKPDTVVNVQPNVVDGGLYPRTAPIMLRFSAPVGDKAAVEDAVTIDVDPRTAGAWSWSDDDTVATWRPEQRWEPDTTVRLLADLYAVRLAEGHYGASDVDIRFRITPD